MKVGITGHQDLGDIPTINWLEKEMSTELNKLNIGKPLEFREAFLFLLNRVIIILNLSKKICK